MTTKLVRDGNKLGTLTTVVEPLQGMPKNYEHNILDLKYSGFPGLNLLGSDMGKPCSVNTETASDGNKTTTTITTKASVDKPLPVSIPGFGIVPAEDTKPCIIAAKTNADGNNVTLITTVVTASREVPGTDEKVPLEASDIDITGIIENPKDAKHGVFVDKVIGDSKEPTIITGTLVTSDDNKPAYPIPKEMIRGQDKPAIVTSDCIECGDVLTTVTTTMIPIQELPKNYKFSTGDLTHDKFPGFEDMPVEDTKPCLVSMEAIPEGNKMKTVAITTITPDDLIQTEPEPDYEWATIDIPGIGKVPPEDTKPCIVSVKPVNDGKRTTFVTTTIWASKETPGEESVPLSWNNIDISGVLESLEDSKRGIYVLKTIGDDDYPTTIIGTLATTDEGSPVPDILPRNQDKPAIVSQRAFRDGDVTTTITTTMVPTEDLPQGYQFTTNDITEGTFPAFGDLPVQQSKPCSVTVETFPAGDKTATVTITTTPSGGLLPAEHDEQPSQPAIINIPGFGEVPAEDTKPCITSTKPIYDGYKTTLMTTTIMASKDDPTNEEGIPLPWKDIDISGIVDKPEDSKPGIYVIKTIGDNDNPTTITGTLITTDEGFPVADVIPRGQDKPAIVTQRAFKDGDVTTTVTTTMVPAEDLPSDYQFTTGDLRENKFPGFDSMPVEQTKPCSVLIETVPEGNKTTTITITTMPVAELIPAKEIPLTEAELEKKPERKSATIDIPGFGEVPSEETKPCIISTKPIFDGYKTTLMTTTIMASKDDPTNEEGIPLSWKDIDISGIVDKPEDSKPGIYVIKTIGDDDNPTTITGTLVTTDEGSPVPDVIPRGQDKPAIVTQRAFRDGDVTTTITKTMIPIEDLPSDYQFTTGDLRENKFPGFGSLPVDETQPCSVMFETVPEGNKITTITITTVSTAELIPKEEIPEKELRPGETSIRKSITIDIPGFGEVPTDETKPCIISTKPIYDGYKTTLMTTTIMASKDDPTNEEGIPLPWKDIDISGIVDKPEDSKPGIYVIKTIGDDDNPTTITGTLVTTDEGSPVPDIMPRDQDKPAVVSQRAFRDGDVTTTITTTMVPAEDLPSDYQFTTGDLRENKFPGFDSMPVEQTKPCSVLIETVPEGNKTTTITITTMPVAELIPTEPIPETPEIKSTTIDIPGFGEVPSEETKPCIISTKPIYDGYKTTLMTTTIMALKDDPKQGKDIPVSWNDINISGIVDGSDRAQPGIYVVKTIGDDDNPTTITGTLVTTEDGSSTPDVIPRRQDKAAIVSQRAFKDGDITTTVTTTMVPAEDYQVIISLLKGI